MLASPLVLTVGGVAKSLIKINQDSYASEYLLREALESYRLKIRHNEAKRGDATVDRHNIEFVHTVYATTLLPEITRKVYLVFEQDKTDTMVNEVKALSDLLIAASNAVTVSLSNWES